MSACEIGIRSVTYTADVTYREQIWNLMTERRWTQADLSLQSGVNPGTLSRFLNEKQDLDVEQLGRIAQAFGMKPGDLLERSDSDRRIVQLQPILDEIAELENGEKAAMVVALAAQVRIMKSWRTPSSFDDKITDGDTTTAKKLAKALELKDSGHVVKMPRNAKQSR